MTRRTNGEVSAPFQRPGSKLWTVVAPVRDGVTGEYKRKWVSGKTPSKASENGRKAQRDAERGFLDRSGTTQLVEQYAEKVWVDVHLEARDIGESSHRSYTQSLRNHVLPVIGNQKLSAVVATDVKRIDATIKRAGLSESTRLKAYVVTNMLFQAALEDRLIHVNPCATLSAPSLPRKAQAHYDFDDAQRLIELSRGYRNLEQLVPFLLFTGLRPGEALALQWSSVKLDAPTPYAVIDATVSMTRDGKLYRKPTTKGKRPRTVPLVAPAVAALRSAKAARATDRLAAGPEWVENDLVFTSCFGKLLDDRNLRQRHSKNVKRAKLDGSFVALRRSTATLLSELGVSVVIIAEILGHSNTRITSRHYTIIDTEAMSTALDKLGKLEAAPQHREAQ